MKLKLLQSMAGINFSHNAGDIIEVNDPDALYLRRLHLKPGAQKRESEFGRLGRSRRTVWNSQTAREPAQADTGG